ncbi:MAG: MerC domain-containing protein [Verrucomicrobiota bacterium]
MNTVSTGTAPFPRTDRIDRLGVAASILCAIHCALAPLLLLAAPVFGRAWANPASHWIIALLVIPLAGFSLFHGRRLSPTWVKWAGALGIAAILGGAALPYVEASEPVGDAACADTCCPSVSTSEEGRKVISIPPASIVTTLGGLFLISAHVGNLRACRQCPNGCCEDPV